MIEEADAWFEYLEAIRGQTAVRYAEIEPWAWVRLTQRLRTSARGARSCCPPPKRPDAPRRPKCREPLLPSG